MIFRPRCEATRLAGAPAEEAVHALQDHAREVLDLHRGRPFDPQHQGPRLGWTAVGGALPLDFFRLRMGGDLRSHDIGPAGDELGRGEALLGEGVAQRLVQKLFERPRIGFAGLVHGASLCHIGRHDASSWH